MVCRLPKHFLANFSPFNLTKHLVIHSESTMASTSNSLVLKVGGGKEDKAPVQFLRSLERQNDLKQGAKGTVWESIQMTKRAGSLGNYSTKQYGNSIIRKHKQ